MIQNTFIFGASPWERVSKDTFVKAEVDENGSLAITTRGQYDHNENKIGDDIHTCTYYRENRNGKIEQLVNEMNDWKRK